MSNGASGVQTLRGALVAYRHRLTAELMIEALKSRYPEGTRRRRRAQRIAESEGDHPVFIREVRSRLDLVVTRVGIDPEAGRRSTRLGGRLVTAVAVRIEFEEPVARCYSRPADVLCGRLPANDEDLIADVESSARRAFRRVADHVQPRDGIDRPNEIAPTPPSTPCSRSISPIPPSPNSRSRPTRCPTRRHSLKRPPPQFGSARPSLPPSEDRQNVDHSVTAIHPATRNPQPADLLSPAGPRS
jgi:hypothetical protein